MINSPLVDIGTLGDVVQSLFAEAGTTSFVLPALRSGVCRKALSLGDVPGVHRLYR